MCCLWGHELEWKTFNSWTAAYALNVKNVRVLQPSAFFVHLWNMFILGWTSIGSTKYCYHSRFKIKCTISPVIFIWHTRCTYSFLFSSVTRILAPFGLRSLTSHTPNSWTYTDMSAWTLEVLQTLRYFSSLFSWSWESICTRNNLKYLQNR